MERNVNMHLGSYAVAVTLAVLSSTLSYAADSPAAPPKGLSFNGKWECSGNVQGDEKSSSRRATYEGKLVSDGEWIELSYVDLDPAGYAATFLIGWDSNKKELVTFLADNKGYATLTGTGWQDKSLTLTRSGPASFKGFSSDKIPLTRVTFEFRSADLFTTTWYIMEGDKWAKDDFLSCKPAKL